MAQAIPYLAFDGNCSEAMRFYEGILGLGAKLEMMLSGADTPMAAEIPREHAHRIVRASSLRRRLLYLRRRYLRSYAL